MKATAVPGASTDRAADLDPGPATGPLTAPLAIPAAPPVAGIDEDGRRDPRADRSGPRPARGRGPGSRRRRWLRRLLAALVLAAAMAATIWVVWYSTVLSVREIRVEGLRGIAPQRVIEAAGVPLGTPLARVDAEAVQARILAMPRIAAVEVRRGWPHELVLVVREREAAGVLSAVDGWWLVDRDGTPYLRVTTPPEDLPVVRAAGDGAAAALAVVAGLPPELTRQVTEVTATTRDDVTLRLRSQATVRWGSAEDGELKARVLAALLPRKATRYDVSAPGLPTTVG